MRFRLFTYRCIHCDHQNDSCIKIGSDDSYFNVSLIVKDKVTRQCPQTTTTYVRVTRSLLLLQHALMQSQVPLNGSLGPRHYRPADNRGTGPPTDQSDRRSTAVDRCLFISRSEHGKGGKWGAVIDGSQ